MNGPELVGRLTALRPTLEAVYVSGYGDDLLVSQLLADPRTLFVQKPCAAATLVRMVEEALARRRATPR